jgi:hypothetical protein
VWLVNKDRFMLCLFQRKMFSVEKYFQGNHFSGKCFLPKIFFNVWHIRKITNMFVYFNSMVIRRWWFEDGLVVVRW